jgi:hypothetical protein
MSFSSFVPGTIASIPAVLTWLAELAAQQVVGALPQAGPPAAHIIPLATMRYDSDDSEYDPDWVTQYLASASGPMITSQAGTVSQPEAATQEFDWDADKFLSEHPELYDILPMEPTWGPQYVMALQRDRFLLPSDAKSVPRSLRSCEEMTDDEKEYTEAVYMSKKCSRKERNHEYNIRDSFEDHVCRTAYLHKSGHTAFERMDRKYPNRTYERNVKIKVKGTDKCLERQEFKKVSHDARDHEKYYFAWEDAKTKDENVAFKIKEDDERCKKRKRDFEEGIREDYTDVCRPTKKLRKSHPLRHCETTS